MAPKFKPNLIIEKNELIFIKLTRNKWAIIDKINYPIVKDYRWCAIIKKHTCYARTVTSSGCSRKDLRMHNLLLKHGIGKEVDHINHNGLDNRLSNLRQATHSQQSINQRIRRNHPTGFKGISLQMPRCRWRVKIQIGGKSKHMGNFICLRKAIEKRDEVYARVYGDFACYEGPR